MTRTLSKTTMNEYSPIIRAIQASLDIRLRDPKMEERKCLRVPLNLGEKYGFVQLAQSMSIIHDWISETGIIIGTGHDAYCFVKTNDIGLWSKMYELIDENMSKYERVEIPQEEKPDKVKKIESSIKIPAETGWKDLEVRFKDAHTITVLLKGTVLGSHGYAALGFAKNNTKDRQPDKQWAFLGLLAVAEQHRGHKPLTKSLFTEPLQTTLDGCDQIKSQLSKKLQLAFGISEDPFYQYDPERGYQPKFILKPEPTLRGGGELHASGGSLYEEKTASIFEDFE